MQVPSTTIKCPNPACSTDIAMSLPLLLSGEKFTCHNCQTSVGLASDSRDVVKGAYDKFLKINK
jgi:hypothetical protein